MTLRAAEEEVDRRIDRGRGPGTPGHRPRPADGADRPAAAGRPAPGDSPARHHGGAVVAGAAAAGGVLAGIGLAGLLGALVAAVALAWAALAVAGLLLSAFSCALAAATHAGTRGWARSRPHRRRAAEATGAALRSGGSATAAAVRSGAAVGGSALRVGLSAGGRLLQAGAATAANGARQGATALREGGPGRRRRRAGLLAHPARAPRPGLLRRQLIGLRRRSAPGLAGLAVLAAVVVAALSIPARAAVGMLSAAVQARSAPLRLPALTEGSTVLAADGQTVAVLRADVNRQPVALGAVAPVLVHAVVDTEDARFWHHGGVDLHALLRAMGADLGAGGARQGASTIAEQLVKNTLLAGRTDDLRRKIQEAVLADRLEAHIGKRAVLADYLNTIYLGEGSYGVQAAAETYFGVPAAAVGPAQAALLAGMIQDPVGYDPLHNPADARARRATVLRLMVAAHDLTPAAARAAAGAPLPASLHLPPAGQNYFVEEVKKELLADPRLGPTPAARYHALFYGGLRIHTTLIPSLQQAAVQAVSRGIPASSLHLSAALAAVDPATGAVRAVVGGPSFQASQFDAAMASPGRPTGSSFKVFTLVAALEEGYSPHDTIDGSGPCTIPDPGGTPDPWVLSNYESENFGTIDLTTATAKSVNCAYARLALMVGLPRVAQVAHQMGVTAPLAVVPSMTLGTNDVPPLQMASAYATLAAGGVYHRPHLVTEVDGPGGRPILRDGGAGVRVMSLQVAREATAILGQVVQQGTGTGAAVPGHPVAGKTGTAAQFQDAWFVGYSPQLAAAVWMGSPSGEVPMKGVEGISVAGGTFPAGIWRDFMGEALAPLPGLGFALPDPAQIPAGTYLQLNQPRAGTGYGPAGGGNTRVTTWCASSCGRPYP